MNYTENFKTIEAIRQKYQSTADILFKTALQEVIDEGKERLQDKDLVNEWYNQIDERHDKADKDGSIPFVGRDFEKAILECAVELAQVNTIDIIKYLQSNWQFYQYDEISYDRARRLLVDVIDCTIDDSEDTSWALNHLHDFGFENDELETLGYKDVFHFDEEADKE